MHAQELLHASWFRISNKNKNLYLERLTPSIKMILQQTNTPSDPMFSTEKGLQQNEFMNCHGTWNLCEMKKIADTSEWDKHYSNGNPLNDSFSSPSFLHTIRKKGEELPNESSFFTEVSKVSPSSSSSSSLFSEDEKRVSISTMKEMIFRMAVMQPIQIDPETVKPPKRRNVKVSKDPQSVAARHRRERISEKIRILQRLVPGGTKMDTASMLDEAIQYMKFLKSQVQIERMSINKHSVNPNFYREFQNQSCWPVEY